MKKRLLTVILLVCMLLGTQGFSMSASAASITVYVISNTLTVYKTPSTSASSMGTMSYGESMTCTATSTNWAQVKNSSGAVGYCKLSGLSNENPNTLSVKVYVSKANTPVYRKPSTSASVMMKLALNASYTAVAKTPDGSWVRLQNGKHYGYVQIANLSSASVDTPSTGDAATVYVASNTLKVYKSASTSAKSLGTMSYGEAMFRLSVSGSWAKVQNSSGATGYCSASALTTTDPNTYSKTVTINTSGAKLYKKPLTSASVVTVLAKNETLTAVAVTADESWVRVKNGSAYAYIEARYVSSGSSAETPGGTVYVASNTLTVFKTASASAKSLGVMSYGEAMLLLGSSGSWAKVQNTAGAVGYCALTGLTDQNPNSYSKAVYAAKAGARIYKKPLTNATVLQTAALGTKMTAVAVTSDNLWLRVEASGSYGYIQAADISTTIPDDDSPDIITVSDIAVYVSDTLLTVYASPATNAKALGTLSFGEEMICNGSGGGWARVLNSSGTTGYCLLSGLTQSNPNIYSVTLYAQTAGVKVYKKPQTSADVMSTLTLNAKVTGVAITADKAWIRLKNGTSYGYVASTAVAETPYSDPGASSTINQIVTLAKEQLGKSYVYGTEGPTTFDCSGFTQYVYSKVTGIKLKRSAYQQGYDSSYAKIESISDLQVGDIVCFNTNSSDDDLSDHVGLYLGSGSFIHCSSAAAKVIISTITSGYYNRVFSWGRRIL